MFGNIIGLDILLCYNCNKAPQLMLNKVGKNSESTSIRRRKFRNFLRKVGPTSIIRSRLELSGVEV